MSPDLARLVRVRWAVRGTLVLGVAASVAANILHAADNPVSQTIAAWPPLALLLTVELISRVPVHRRSLAGVRLVATAAIASIAAWVSYWHMAGVTARYGETGGSQYLIPVSVDGLVVVASVCLVELGGRIRDADPAATPEPLTSGADSATEPGAVLVPPAVPVPAEVTPPAPAGVVPEPATPEPVPMDRPPRPRARKPAGSSVPKRPFAVTQQAAASMEAGGMSVLQIAAALGIGERQVRNALRPVPVGDPTG